MSAFRTSLFSVTCLAAFCLTGPAMADGMAAATPARLNVAYDQATAIHLETSAKTVVVGNASIAEAVLVNDKTIYVQGRIFGNTNLIALDSNGTEILNTQITVGAPDAAQVTLYRGGLQQNLACSPRCEHTVTVGDAGVDTEIKNSTGKMEVGKAGTDLSAKP